MHLFFQGKSGRKKQELTPGMDTATLLEMYEKVAEHKHQSLSELQADFKKLKEYQATENQKKYCGNRIVYHFFLREMMKIVAGHSYCSMEDILKTPELVDYWLGVVERAKKKRKNVISGLFEAIRQTVPVFMFKPSTAKYVYKHFQPTSILDPCAGWGGRLLGAAALNIPYIGFDTNVGLQEPYKKMIETLELDPGNYQVILKSCLEVDYSQYEFDLVFTSPPYYNLEKYPGMTPWNSEKEFYQDFLISLLDKLQANIKKPGWICFNISGSMYEKLTDIYKFKKSTKTLQYQEQKRYKKDGDLIYCWKVE